MKKFNPQSKFSLSIKELITGALGLGSLLAVFFTLKADIALAKQLLYQKSQKLNCLIKMS